jgi:hypothetical protein
MKKRQKGQFSWPFAKHRQMGIEQGDRLCEQAESFVDGVDPSIAEQGSSNWRSYRRAGRFFERAATIYRRVGMGALARSAFDRAADCWIVVGDEDLLKSAERLSSSICTYWEEEEDDQ